MARVGRRAEVEIPFLSEDKVMVRLHTILEIIHRNIT